jgi:uncharacterized protein YndB with AHSA1/START domain
MASINHKIGVNTGVESVLETLTTPEGLSKWWTREVGGGFGVGEVIEFRFNGNGPDMKVIKIANNHVEWKCIAGPEEWINTHIIFRVEETDEEVLIYFSHEGWASISEFHHHCSMKWAVFLLSLKNYLEEGEGQPFPNDVHINHTNY